MVLGIGVTVAVVAAGVGGALATRERPADPGGPATPGTSAVRTPAPTPSATPVPRGAGDLDVARVLEHLGALQDAADAHGGTRATGHPGYDASVAYVLDTLRAAGYAPVVERVPTPALRDDAELSLVAPTARPLVRGREFRGNQLLSPVAASVTGPVVPVDLGLDDAAPVTSGCEAADYAGLPAEAVALTRRGGCHPLEKARLAYEAGAVGLLVMNDGAEGHEPPFVVDGNGDGTAIPVMTLAYTTGVELATTDAARATMVQPGGYEQLMAVNVLVETAGDPDRVVVVGAHLDGAPAGPGINDNGTGAAALLALAERLAGADPGATVRLAWWGAEEDGLLGSTGHVAGLDDAERGRVVAYLNADMLGSPNGHLGVLDGDGSVAPGAVPLPPGSAQVEQVLQALLAGAGVPYEEAVVDGASDYVPFAHAGIPVGGVQTGSWQGKTEDQVERFGGVAGVPLDPCYHEACDSLTPPAPGARPAVLAELAAVRHLVGNVDVGLLDLAADLVAEATLRLAADPSLVALDAPTG